MSTTSRKARCRFSRTTSTTASRKSFKAVFEDLGEDQLAEVIAFCWVGQGTYEAADWDEAMQEAQDLVGESTEEAIERTDGPADARLGARIRVSPPSISAATGSARSPSARERSSWQAVPTAHRDSDAGPSRESRAAAAGSRARAQLAAHARSFGGTLFWIVTCGRQPPASCALSRP